VINELASRIDELGTRVTELEEATEELEDSMENNDWGGVSFEVCKQPGFVFCKF
jgi:hypothetical protein